MCSHPSSESAVGLAVGTHGAATLPFLHLGQQNLCLCSLQWNFLQAGAAQALGQALQDNRSLASLQ